MKHEYYVEGLWKLIDDAWKHHIVFRTHPQDAINEIESIRDQLITYRSLTINQYALLDGHACDILLKLDEELEMYN